MTNLDVSLAKKYLDQAKQVLCEDDGKLWGVSLFGPIIIVDYETRQVVANQEDYEGNLQEEDPIWVGYLPNDVTLENSVVNWAGVNWIMLIWQSLSDDPIKRTEFIAHESFHRIQNQIFSPMQEIPNANVHLDTYAGRYWLQLEWRALEKVLSGKGQERFKAIEDALLFRAYRRLLIPNAAYEERALEMHEGLAEYTGFAIRKITLKDACVFLKSTPERNSSFVRSFAYSSGPAYGLILDLVDPAWKIGLTPKSDFGELLKEALLIQIPENLGEKARWRALDYGGKELHLTEMDYSEKRIKRIESYKKYFFNEPVLILPITNKVQCSFDPRTIIPIPNGGTVFPYMNIVDSWGTLSVTSVGLLMDPDWKLARVSAPKKQEESSWIGKGWILKLKENWSLIPVSNSPNWKLIQQA